MMDKEEGVERRDKGKEEMSVGSPWGEEGCMISSDSVVLRPSLKKMSNKAESKKTLKKS